MAERDTPAPDAVAGGAKPKKGSKFALLLLPLAFLPAVGGGYLAFSQYPRLMAAVAAFGVGTDDADEADDTDTSIEYGQFMELEGLIINPAGSDGKRYLMVNIGLEGPDEAVLAEVQEREVVVRDTILKVLGRRSVAELADVALRTELKDEIVSAVNAVTRKGKIERMYFTQFVLQ